MLSIGSITFCCKGSEVVCPSLLVAFCWCLVCPARRVEVEVEVEVIS